MLHVRLLGPLEVQVAGRPVEPPASRRAWELLAWLALHPGEHPRGPLAARFWPDVLDSSARASLRSAAWALRRALGAEGAESLEAGRERLALRCTTDLEEFDRLVAAGAMEAAAALHRGPLLADLDEDWVHEERDRQTARLAAILARLADEAPTPDLAVAHARRRLALDPLDEAAARDLMDRLAAAGDRAAALAVHDRLAERLRAQLGLAPSAETRETARRVRSAPPAAPGGPAREPVIGREAELEALLAMGAGVAVLRGEAGIGKTHLARQVVDRARAAGARTASCAALELGGPAPYSLWTELLRELADDLPAPPAEAAWPEDLAAIAPSLPRRLGRRVSAPAQRPAPDLARSRLLEAAVDAIEHAVADRPLVLFFDDVHLADAASLELLTYVLRRSTGLGVLAVLTCRTTPERPDLDALLRAHAARGGALAEFDLAPLAWRDVERLVGSVASLPADLREQVVAAADGNPLLAIESARATATGHEGPPPSLQAVVRAAVGRLPEGGRRASELAAVAGRDLSLAELGALVSQDDLLAALDCGLVASTRGSFGYRHALLRDAALALMPDPRRRALHEELAAALRGSAAEVARHLRLAGRDDLAADHLAGAARHAVAVGALDEAAAFLHEALELRPGDPALLIELAQAEAYNGRRAAAEEALGNALASLDPAAHAERAAAHARAARWYSGALCHPGETFEQAQRALAELDRVAEPDGLMLGSVLALGAWGSAVVGRLKITDALLDRIAEVDVDDPDLRCDLANAHAFRALAEGHLDEATEHFESIAGAPGIAPDRAYGVRINLACMLAAQGRYADALRCAEAGIGEVRRLPILTAPLQAVRAALLARLGRVGEAQEAVAEERRAAERGGDSTLAALADHDAGMVAFGAGDHAVAAELIARGLESGALVNRPLARLAVAESFARLGRLDEAEAELRAVTLEPLRPGDRPAVLVARLTHVQGLVALARGDIELGRRRLEEAAAGWRRVPGETGGAHLVTSLVDLGRPTLVPLEPAREQARVERELRDLATTGRDAGHARVR
jgi:DNA-binding SARP family transcriptional activator/tetratricopeptide (TPR) repeat protein